MEEYKLGSCRGWILGIYLPVSKVHQSKQPRFCLLFVVEAVSRRAAACICAGSGPSAGCHPLGCRLGGDYDKLRGLSYHHVTIMLPSSSSCARFARSLGSARPCSPSHNTAAVKRGGACITWWVFGCFKPLILDCHNWTTPSSIFLIGWWRV